jgi:hypothetical protein
MRLQGSTLNSGSLFLASLLVVNVRIVREVVSSTRGKWRRKMMKAVLYSTQLFFYYIIYIFLK